MPNTTRFLVYCVASPILGSDGAAIGAIGVSLVHPLAVRDPGRVGDVKRHVRDCAHALTKAFAGPQLAADVFGAL